jgi:hypothetical protein
VQVLALLATAATLGLMLAVGLTSYFGTDEFNYAHAAWAIAQGQQPYRDFFLHHFPGSCRTSACQRVAAAEEGSRKTIFPPTTVARTPTFSMASGGMAVKS